MDQHEEAVAHLRRLGGDAFVVEVIDGFLATATRRLDEARQGLAAGNFEAVAFAMHSLKSSAGNLGLTTVQTLSDELEKAAEAGAYARASAGMEAVLQAFAREQRRLSALRERLR